MLFLEIMNKSSGLIPIIDGQMQRNEKRKRAEDFTNRKETALKTFLTKYCQIRDFDMDYIIGDLKSRGKVDLNGLIYQHDKPLLPSYCRNPIQKAIEGVIVDGDCSRCFLVKNHTDIRQCNCSIVKIPKQSDLVIAQQLPSASPKPSAPPSDILPENISDDLSGKMSDDLSLTCSICMDRRKNIVLTPCGHCYCYECVVLFTRKNDPCPTCRAKIKSTNRLYL
jgi:hypothetical protein